MRILLIIILQLPLYTIIANKNNFSDISLENYILTYFEEANYPDDIELKVIEDDLKLTLELDECKVLKK